jgi:hypothetical protein
MSRILRHVTFTAFAIVGVLGASLGAASGTTTTPLVGGAHPVTATIRIDSGDTFRPPPPHAKPKLSAVTAWQQYTRSIGHPQKRPRAGNKMWIGRFTSKNEPYNKLAYGYEWTKPLGCIYTIPNPHPKQCRDWTFVSANTGKSLGNRMQVLKRK